MQATTFKCYSAEKYIENAAIWIFTSVGRIAVNTFPTSCIHSVQLYSWIRPRDYSWTSQNAVISLNN